MPLLAIRVRLVNMLLETAHLRVFIALPAHILLREAPPAAASACLAATVLPSAARVAQGVKQVKYRKQAPLRVLLVLLGRSRARQIKRVSRVLLALILRTRRARARLVRLAHFQARLVLPPACLAQSRSWLLPLARRLVSRALLELFIPPPPCARP